MNTNFKRKDDQAHHQAHPQDHNKKEFLYQREAAIWVVLIQACAVMLFVLIGAILIGAKKGWIDLWLDAALISWGCGALYYGFSLWRWNKLSWLENAIGVNLDSDPRIGNGKRPTMHIKITLPDGDVRSAESELFENQKRYLIAVARATIAGRPNSQKAMSKGSGSMSRPKHEAVMKVYIRLGVLRKESEHHPNSKYIIAEPIQQNRAILQAISVGDFDMLEDVWSLKR